MTVKKDHSIGEGTGAVAGAIAGGAAGSAAGPVGTVVGAIVGGALPCEASEACTIRVGLAGGSPRSIASTVFIPAITRPNTVYFRSSAKRG